MIARQKKFETAEFFIKDILTYRLTHCSRKIKRKTLRVSSKQNFYAHFIKNKTYFFIENDHSKNTKILSIIFRQSPKNEQPNKKIFPHPQP